MAMLCLTKVREYIACIKLNKLNIDGYKKILHVAL